MNRLGSYALDGLCLITAFYARRKAQRELEVFFCGCQITLVNCDKQAAEHHLLRAIEPRKTVLELSRTQFSRKECLNLKFSLEGGYSKGLGSNG